MKKTVLLLLLTVSLHGAYAQSTAADTTHAVQLKEVDVVARWKNDTDRYRYNQMKFYVTTVMPYVNAATKLFIDINSKTEEPGVRRKERRRYIDAKEDELRSQFEDKIKNLNVTQGGLLVKLIARQTDLNIYKMLLKFKNPLVAIKWQTWARLNGMNLDKKYHPEEEHDLERIMEDLGYPLQGSYITGNQ